MRATPTTEELMERRELAVVIAILVVSAVGKHCDPVREDGNGIAVGLKFRL